MTPESSGATMPTDALSHPASPDHPDLEIAWQSALQLSEKGLLEPVRMVTLAERMSGAGRHQELLLTYRHWLQHHVTPLNHVIRFNLGVLLAQMGDNAGAEQEYREALREAPGFRQAWFNLGTVLEKQHRREHAVDTWEALLSVLVDGGDADLPMRVMCLNNLGRLLEDMREFARAEDYLRASLLIDPAQPNVIQHWVHLRQKQCKWPVYAPLPGLSPGQMLKATSPLAMLAISDDTGLQLATAVHFARERIQYRQPALAPVGGYRHERLRIGFLSSDLCMHAVSLLTVELFELLDKSRFELYGFCWSREDGSEVRARIKAALDHFVPIGALDDATAARLIRHHEIDALIDLQGLTSGARPDIIAARPAPVQMTYLGFPGPTGMPSIDHVFADRYLIPDGERPFYSEVPLYLPGVYQCSDRKRPVGVRPSRAECGLPGQGTVFCCFNNNYKFTPDMFATWMRILARVPGSVLWLLADNPWAKEQMLARAVEAGIDPARLVFGARLAPPDYLARYAVADLFLDCFPFNAGTTANDALFMGLPVLTLSGRAFASRMAGALLTALGVPELITHTLADYEEQAVALGSDPVALAALRRKVETARQTSALFDMSRFVQAFCDVIEQRLKTP